METLSRSVALLPTLAANVALVLCAFSTTVSPPNSHASLERQLLADAADGALDRFSLLDAALIAGSECSADVFEARRHYALAQCCELSATAGQYETAREKSKAIFRFLHQRLLTGDYRLECEDVGESLSTGVYNCVTATVLYCWLCERCGVDVTPMFQPEHVFCRVTAPDAIDVETTCPDWFDRSADAGDRPTQTPLAQARPLTAVQLLAKVYHNRAVTLLESGAVAEASRVAAVSVALDRQDDAAVANLLAAWNNWALELGEEGRFPQALKLIEDGLRLDGANPMLLNNDVHLHQRWVTALCASGQHAQAIAVLERGRRRRPQVALFDEGRAVVCQLWARSLSESGRTQEAAAVRRLSIGD